MFADGTGHLFALSFHPGEPRRTVRLRRLGELIDVLARQHAAALHGDAAHAGAIRQRALEERHGERTHVGRPIGDGKLEPQIRLVGAEALVRLTPRETGKRPIDPVTRFVP